ncbi:MAG: hypothetical protein LBD50_01810 [Rickettsiales bacterium]|jgi:hypothetical protein|nr:hypothetical protein [Rickettsiales bacterium]
MKLNEKFFSARKFRLSTHERGGMMAELLLTLALVALVLPFIINFQKSGIERAQNIATVKEMELMQTALERYIDFHKSELLAPIGKNITRVKVPDLEEYGAPARPIEENSEKFQIRIIKSSDREGRATLQGVIVLNDPDISPIKTREIVNIGGSKMGFVEKGKAFGAFGTWRANTSDLGIGGKSGIVKTTKTTLDKEQYLWRIPSENTSDATMLSSLNLAGHNIVDAKFTDGRYALFEEILKSKIFAAGKIIFQNRTTIDKNLKTGDAIVAGTLSADSRNFDIYGTLSLSDTAKFSSFTADKLWVGNLNLSGISIAAETGKPAVLKVNQTMDMVSGRISAMFATVGFTGSLTPKLVIRSRIEDSANSGYFWDASTSSAAARFSDVYIAELNRMAAISASKEAGEKTASGQIFKAVVTNKNATASDFINAISEIQNKVRIKYRQLNLE